MEKIHFLMIDLKYLKKYTTPHTQKCFDGGGVYKNILTTSYTQKDVLMGDGGL